jgi:hypothetical protein
VSVVRHHEGEPFPTEHVRPVEEAVLKTVAPCNMASGVQVPGAPPFPTTPDSSKAERPAYIRLTRERYLLGRPFLRFLRSSKAEQPVDNRQTAARYRAEGPSRWMAESVNAAA